MMMLNFVLILVREQTAGITQTTEQQKGIPRTHERQNGNWLTVNHTNNRLGGFSIFRQLAPFSSSDPTPEFPFFFFFFSCEGIHFFSFSNVPSHPSNPVEAFSGSNVHFHTHTHTSRVSPQPSSTLLRERRVKKQWKVKNVISK